MPTARFISLGFKGKRREWSRWKVDEQKCEVLWFIAGDDVGGSLWLAAEVWRLRRATNLLTAQHVSQQVCDQKSAGDHRSVQSHVCRLWGGPTFRFSCVWMTELSWRAWEETVCVCVCSWNRWRFFFGSRYNLLPSCTECQLISQHAPGRHPHRPSNPLPALWSLIGSMCWCVWKSFFLLKLKPNGGECPFLTQHIFIVYLYRFILNMHGIYISPPILIGDYSERYLPIPIVWWLD